MPAGKSSFVPRGNSSCFPFPSPQNPVVTRDEFDGLVHRLEKVSRRHPRLFFARVTGLVLLAYGYLALILLGTLALCVGIIALALAAPNGATIKLGLIGLVFFGGLFWAVLRGLWVKLEPPEGQPVTRTQVPKLFQMLDELRAALRCRPFHQVLLVPEHNAAVVQIPRLGVFGWHQNYLLLGLPLMQSLAPDEFKAVLAHEFAHSSRGHGRFGNWLYRVRRSWDRIFEQMARQRSRGSVVLTSFIKWFWPHFNGHAFVLARANEYEADACSVRLAGADAAANALMRLPVDGALLSEQFWPHVYTQANTHHEPPGAVMRLQADALKSGPASADAARWLRQAFLRETNNADTHPCLKDRLRAMNRLPAGVEHGEFPAPPPRPEQSAAEFFLGDHAPVAMQQMSDTWRQAIAEQWSARHQRTQELSQELTRLETPAQTPASVEELWNKAVKLMELHNDVAAAPVIEQLLILDPQHVGANFVRGRQLLEKDDAAGVVFLETAMTADPATTADGCNLLYGYYTRTGQRDKLRPLEDRMDAFQAEAARAQNERNHITARDIFLPPELKSDQLAALQKLFAGEKEIASVAVARKQVRHFPTSACFVVALRIKVPVLSFRSSGANQKLVQRMADQIKLPGHFLVFVAEANLKSLAKKISAVPGAVVYERPKPA